MCTIFGAIIQRSQEVNPRKKTRPKELKSTSWVMILIHIFYYCFLSWGRGRRRDQPKSPPPKPLTDTPLRPQSFNTVLLWRLFLSGGCKQRAKNNNFFLLFLDDQLLHCAAIQDKK